MSLPPFDIYRTLYYQIRTQMRDAIRDITAVLLPVEVRASTAVELLVGLYATTTPDARSATWAPPLAELTPATRRALEAVGAEAGEVWLHVLGVALDAD